jgi:hypothetical protein
MKNYLIFLVVLFLHAATQALLVVGDTSDSSIYSTGTGAGTGWDYVGSLNGSAPSSVTYVSNGWFVTANHVWTSDVVGKSETTLELGGTAYTIDSSSYTSITNSSGTAADLCMFRVADLVGLPSGISVMTKTPRGNDSLILIGNGYDNEDSTGLTWGNGTLYGSGPSVYSYTVSDTVCYMSLYYTNSTGSAYGQTYDSGGGVFVDGQLAGIMVATATGVEDGITFITDFSEYGSQINTTSAIPEPTTGILLAGVAIVFGLIKRFRYMYQ